MTKVVILNGVEVLVKETDTPSNQNCKSMNDRHFTFITHSFITFTCSTRFSMDGWINYVETMYQKDGYE